MKSLFNQFITLCYLSFLLSACPKYLFSDIPPETVLPENPGTANIPATWEVLVKQAVRLKKSGELENALKLCQEARGMAEKFPPGDMYLIRSWMLEGMIQQSLDNPELAENSYNRAVSLTEQTYGPNHPALVTPLEQLANFYYFTKTDYKEAARIAEQIMVIVEQNLHQTERALAARSYNLAQACMLAGNYVEAEPFYQKAITFSARSGSGDSWKHYINQAEFYKNWGKNDLAIKSALTATEVLEEQLASTHGLRDRIPVQMNLSEALAALGKTYDCAKAPTKSLEVYGRAITIISEIQGNESRDLVSILSLMLKAQCKLEEFDQAEVTLGKITGILQTGDPQDKELLKQIEEVFTNMRAQED